MSDPSHKPGRYRCFCSSVPKWMIGVSQAHICAFSEKIEAVVGARIAERLESDDRRQDVRPDPSVLLRDREPEQAEIGALRPGLA